VDQTNYSPYFVINSPNTVVSSTAVLTYAAETTGVQSLTSAFPTEVVTGEVGGTATSVGPAASITATGGVPGSKTTSGLTAASSVTVESAKSSGASGLSTVVSSAQGSLAGFAATTTSSKAGASMPTGTSGKRVAIVVAAAVGMAWGV